MSDLHLPAGQRFSWTCASYSLAEVLDGGENRVGRGAAERAQRAVHDVVAELLEQLDVAVAAVAVLDAVQDLEHALGAQTAGHALAAALLLGEVQEEARQVDHAGLVVDDHHAAGADYGAGLGEALVVDRRVEQTRRHAAARRTTELHGLEGLAVLDAAADVEDDVAQRRAHRHLDETAVDDLAGQAEGLGAAARLDAHRGVGLGPVGDDPRHVGEGLDVVDVRRLAPEAGHGRVRRARARHAALALDARDERRLLAADEGAGAELEVQIELPARAEAVGAQEAVRLRVRHGLREALDGQRVLGAHVHVALVRADGDSCR